MRIFGNILQTFRLSRRLSYSSTTCPHSPVVCMNFRKGRLTYLRHVRDCVSKRLLGSKSGNSQFYTPSSGNPPPRSCDQSDKRNAAAAATTTGADNFSDITNILPVALISSTDNAASTKILLIPINLFQSDDDAVQRTLSTLSVLRDHARQIEAFTDSLTEFSFNNRASTKNSKVIAEKETPLLTEFEGKDKTELWQTTEETAKENEKQQAVALYDPLDQPQRKEMETNHCNPSDAFDVIKWNDSKRHLFAQVPETLQEKLKHMAISSVQLAFEMDMTNIRDAIMLGNKARDLELFKPPKSTSLKDPTLALTTCLYMDTAQQKHTVPLNFHALIQGTIEIDPSKLSPEQIRQIKVPEFNDSVTTIAANICSTALQKGFPSDIGRKSFSTQSTYGASDKGQRNPHIVCVREGEKGCVSPGNSSLPIFKPNGSRSNSDGSGKKNKSKGSDQKCSDTPLLSSSAIIGDCGARGLMSCGAYKRALEEAAKRREAMSQGSKPKSKSSCKPCSSESMESQSICGQTKEKASPCGDKQSVKPNMEAKKKKNKNKKEKCGWDPCKKKDDCEKEELPPCKPKKKKYKAPCNVEKKNDPCKSNKKSPCHSSKKETSKKEKNQKGGKKASDCNTPEAKPNSSIDCKTADPCFIKKDAKPSLSKKSDSKTSCGSPKKSETQINCASAKKSELGSKSSCGSPKKSDSKCGSPKKSESKSSCGSQKKSDSNSTCGSPKKTDSKCTPKKSDSMCGSAKKSDSKSICGSPTKSDFKSSCGSPKKSDSKCGSPKKSESKSSYGSPKKSDSKSSCGSPKKSDSNSTCGSPKKPDSKCTPKKSDSKCGSPKKSDSKCGSPKKSDSKSSCGSPKKSNSKSICGSPKKSDSKSSCGSPKKSDSKSSCGSPKKSDSKCGSPKKSASKSSCGSPKKSDSQAKCASVKKDSKGGKESGKKEVCNKPEQKPNACFECNTADPCFMKNKSDTKSSCGSPKKSESKSSCGSDKKSESKSSCGSPKKSDSKSSCGSPKTTGSKTSCGSPKKSDSKSICGSPKKSDSKSSCGSQTKTGSKCTPKKSDSKCGSPKKSDSKSICGSPKKSNSKSSCGSPKKSDSKSSCGSPKKTDSKSICGSPKKSDSKSSCGSPKKSDSKSICGSPKKSDSKSSCGSPKKNDSKCTPKNNKSQCGGSNNKDKEKKATICPNTGEKAKYSTKPNCGKGDKKGGKSGTDPCKKSFSTAAITSTADELGKSMYSCIILAPLKRSFSTTSAKLTRLFSTSNITCKKCGGTTIKMPKNRKNIKRRNKLKNCFGKSDECPKPLCKPAKETACNKEEKRGKKSKKGKKKGKKENKHSMRSHFSTSHAASYVLKRMFGTSVSSRSRVNCHDPCNNGVLTEKSDEDEKDKACNEQIKISDAGKIEMTCEAIPNMSDYDVLIRTEAVAISGSDIHIYETGGKSSPGITLGHDAAGVVEKIGRCIYNLKPGDRVAVESGLSCGICDFCKRGLYNLCAQLIFNGFLSKYQVHPADLCHKIPHGVCMEEATLTQTLALGCQACIKAHITPITNVLVIGSCPTAVAAAISARAFGARKVCITSTMHYTLESIRRSFDFDFVLYDDCCIQHTEALESIFSTLNDWPDVVINCAISENTMNLAVMALQVCGTCVLAECETECACFNAMDLLMKNLRMVPSFRSTNMFPTAIHLMQSGQAPVEGMIARIYKWQHVDAAFRTALHESNVGYKKVIVKCAEEENCEEFEKS